MKYAVYDNNRPAKFPDINVHPSWSNNEFATFNEALVYAKKWLGEYGVGVPMEVNVPWDYSGFGDMILIKGEPQMETVIILCGISGSGKSTRVAKCYPDATVCSADHYFIVKGEYKFNPALLPDAHGACLRSFVSALMRSEKLIVVDNTNSTIPEVAPYAALALAFGYNLKIEILKTDVETAAKRNLHGVPKETITKMAERLETLKESLPPWWPCEEV